ncbi:hypothetical protein Cni_G26249 [Canna indica]|uniref:Uncharacterized protein n=1 Tax=Canna indica TaxID=4628 RepID=A0AAQ3KYN0_9LILI|nr:hypothetical protein Cni_G26249 [Canna indica]
MGNRAPISPLPKDTAMGLVLSAATRRGWTTGSGMEGPPIPADSDSIDQAALTQLIKFIVLLSEYEGHVHLNMNLNSRVQLPGPTLSHCIKVRREKINERMKLLQDLVPGCTNMTCTAREGEAILPKSH